MDENIRLCGHVAATNLLPLYKASNRLFATTKFSYFCYLRRYKDGSFTFLPTMIDFGRYLFEDKMYPNTWFAGIPFGQLKSGYSFWEIAKQVSEQATKDIGQDITNFFNLSSGIEIIEKHRDYCDFYSFSGDDPIIYFTPMQLLYQFIYYFKQECRSLLLAASEDRLQLHNKEATVSSIPIMTIGDAQTDVQSSNFSIKRYYLEGEYKDVFLTKREVEILRRLEQGGAIKRLADALCVSPKTLDNHITNIKSKLQVSRATELLRIARLNNLLV